MNKLSLLFLAITVPMWLKAQPPKLKPVTLKGTLDGFTEQPIYILFYYADAARKIPDTARVIKGKYTWQGQVDAPTRFLLTARYANNTGGKKDNAVVFLEPGIINITHVDSFSRKKVTGSVSQPVYEQLQALDDAYGSSEGKHLTSDQIMEFYRRKTNDIYGNYARQHPQSPLALYVLRMYGGGYTVDGSRIDSLFGLLPQNLQQSAEGKRLRHDIEWSRVMKLKQKEEIAAYIRNYPNSPVALEALERYCGYSIDVASAEPLFQLLPGEVKRSVNGQKFAARLQAAAATAIGKIAPSFTQNDTLGNPFSLSQLRGHYVLIDFWASWCKPCRKENPNVVAAFNQYKGKGFTVLGVSLEQPNARSAWLKAIHADSLTWHHVSDFNYWNNAVAVLYGIKAVPQNLLIDPHGTIIARNLYGKQLQQKLEEIYK